MKGWKNCQLGDILTFQRGYDLPKSQMVQGQYPVVGSNGIIGYHNKYTTEAPSITIGRSGNTGTPYIVYGRSWSHNTTLYVKEFKSNYPVYIYYLLKTLDLNNYAGGSAVPTLNRNHIHTLSVSVPKLSDQIVIAGILKTLDDKIAVNLKINHNLSD
jgi:type I restriction enzyme S subunit